MATQPQRDLIIKLVKARSQAMESQEKLREEIKQAWPDNVHWKVTSALIDRIKALPCDPREDQDVDQVRAVISDIKDSWLRLVVPDIISKFDNGVMLSEKQRDVLRRAYADATKEPLVPGMYKMGDKYYKVMYNKAKRLSAKELVVRPAFPNPFCEFVFRRDVLDKLTVDMKLSEEEARQFGHKFKVCCNCGEPIGHGDKRGTLMSYAVGYGPVCAANNGWSYPRNVYEAIDTCHRLGLQHPLLTIIDSGLSVDEAENKLSQQQTT